MRFLRKLLGWRVGGLLRSEQPQPVSRDVLELSQSEARKSELNLAIQAAMDSRPDLTREEVETRAIALAKALMATDALPKDELGWERTFSRERLEQSVGVFMKMLQPEIVETYKISSKPLADPDVVLLPDMAWGIWVELKKEKTFPPAVFYALNAYHESQHYSPFFWDFFPAYPFAQKGLSWRKYIDPEGPGVFI
jgi:hypothetical protein